MLILVNGLKQSGKSTIASFLKNEGFQTVKFAGTLKEMIRAYLHFCGYGKDIAELLLNGPDELRETPLKCFNGKSTRYVMQYLGTEWRNHVRDTMWSEIAFDKIERILLNDGKVLVDDMRFIHEIESMYPLVNKFGGVKWSIRRPNTPVFYEQREIVQHVPATLNGIDAAEVLIYPLLKDLGFTEKELVDISVGENIRYLNTKIGKTVQELIDLLSEWWDEYIIERPVPVTSKKHVSEVPMDDNLFDDVIVNDGTLEDLKSKIQKLYSEVYIKNLAI